MARTSYLGGTWAALIQYLWDELSKIIVGVAVYHRCVCWRVCGSAAVGTVDVKPLGVCVNVRL